ncbi:MAG: hypothetical protein ACYDCI_05710 [Candidatus Limnocylindrales bacterium]
MNAARCHAAFSGHLPDSPVGQYVVLTSSGRRVITACRGCADSALAMGMGLIPDQRRGQRGTTADRRVEGFGRPEWLRRGRSGENRGHDLTGLIPHG